MRKSYSLNIFSILLIAAMATSVVYHTTQKGDINYSKGKRLFIKARYRKAIPFFEKAISYSPENSDARKSLAYSYLWTHRPEKAITIFQKYIAEHPEDIKAKASLAEALAWQHKYNESIAIYRELIAAGDYLWVKEDLAEVYIWKKEPDKAIVLLREVLKDRPDDYRVRMLWGKALLYSGRGEEATGIFEGLMKEIREKKKFPDDKREIKE